MFGQLRLGTFAMLAFVYAGDTGAVVTWIGCISGMCGRFYILHGIFMGAAGGVAGECSQASKESLNNMRFIVIVGWSTISSATSSATCRARLIRPS